MRRVGVAASAAGGLGSDTPPIHAAWLPSVGCGVEGRSFGDGAPSDIAAPPNMTSSYVSSTCKCHVRLMSQSDDIDVMLSLQALDTLCDVMCCRNP